MAEQVTDLTPEREQELREWSVETVLYSDDQREWQRDVRDLLAALDAERARAEEAIREADGMARAPYGEFIAMRERMEAAEARSRDPHHALRVLAAECMESGLEIGELVEEIRSQVLAPEQPALSSKGRTAAFEAENPGSSPGSADHLRNLEAVAEAAREVMALHGYKDVVANTAAGKLRAALAVLEESQ